VAGVALIVALVTLTGAAAQQDLSGRQEPGNVNFAASRTSVLVHRAWADGFELGESGSPLLEDSRWISRCGRRGVGITFSPSSKHRPRAVNEHDVSDAAKFTFPLLSSERSCWAAAPVSVTRATMKATPAPTATLNILISLFSPSFASNT